MDAPAPHSPTHANGTAAAEPAAATATTTATTTTAAQPVSPARAKSPARAAPASPARPASPTKVPAAAASPRRSPAKASAPSNEAAPVESAPAAPAAPVEAPAPVAAPSATATADAIPPPPADQPAAEPMDVDTPTEAEPTESAPATAPASDAEGAESAPKTPKTPARRKSKPRRITMTKTRRSSTARHRTDLVRFDADDEPPKVDDVVFAQVKGHPFWPAMVLADSNVPAEMLAQRKHPSEVPVIFFGSFQFGFIPPDLILPFEPNVEALQTKGNTKAVDQARDERELAHEEVRKWHQYTEARKMQGSDDELAEDDEMAEESDEPAPARPSRAKATPKRKAASKASSTPTTKAKATPRSSRKRTTAEHDEDEHVEAATPKRPKRKGKQTAAADDDDAPGPLVGEYARDMLMKWRHTLQKTFIKDKSIGDAPRVQPATIATVDWAAVNATFKHMLAYLNGEHFNAALFNETKIPKVLRMIAQAQFDEAVTPVLEAQNVAGKVQDVLDALAAKMA